MDLMQDKKRELLDKLIEQLSMMEDPLDMEPGDKEAEVEVKIETKPEGIEDEKASEEKASEEIEDEDEVLKRKLKHDMAMGL